MNGKRVLVINPGASSTKFAVYEGEQVLRKRILEHSVSDLGSFAKVFEQYRYRLDLILDDLMRENIALATLSAVVGRGGLLKPLASGTYLVNATMIDDLRRAPFGEHASNLGAVMANQLADGLGIPAFIVDPVSVDELEPVARISGLADVERASLSHALNMKAAARKVAKAVGKKYEELNLVVAHLGSGVSVAPHARGRMIDVNNPREEGPFSSDRCGGLPAYALINLCYSGRFTQEEMKDRLMAKGGLYSYLGTRDVREAERLAVGGDEQAAVVLEALSYQVSKEIGAMAAVLAGQVDRIVLIGGMAHSGRVVDAILRRVSFIAPVAVVPGEEELEALAFGALRVLNGEETAWVYE